MQSKSEIHYPLGKNVFKMKDEWVMIFLVNNAMSKLPTTARKISISEVITVLNRGVKTRKKATD